MIGVFPFFERRAWVKWLTNKSAVLRQTSVGLPGWSLGGCDVFGVCICLSLMLEPISELSWYSTCHSPVFLGVSICTGRVCCCESCSLKPSHFSETVQIEVSVGFHPTGEA